MNPDTRDGLKSQLIEMRKRLCGELESTCDSLREVIVKPGDITSLPTDPSDADVEGVEVEIALSRNEEHLLEQVDVAMERLDAGTYGMCHDCGTAIDPERLQAIPYTDRCIDCARNQRDEIKTPIRSTFRRLR